jgi:hypothetical protein
MKRRGGPHHHFFGGGRVVSPSLVAGVARAAPAAAGAALRMSAAAFRALASGPGGLSGVILVNAAPTTALLALCRLTSSVRTMRAWRSASLLRVAEATLRRLVGTTVENMAAGEEIVVWTIVRAVAPDTRKERSADFREKGLGLKGGIPT